MKILKNKRGIAIESAVLFMLVVFFLCTSISFVAVAGHKRINRNAESLKERVQIDQIGEDFLAGGLKAEYENYVCAVDGNTLTVKTKGTDNVVLCVELDGTSVKSWRYTN